MESRGLNPKGISAEGPSRGHPGGAKPWTLHWGTVGTRLFFSFFFSNFRAIHKCKLQPASQVREQSPRAGSGWSKTPWAPGCLILPPTPPHLDRVCVLPAHAQAQGRGSASLLTPHSALPGSQAEVRPAPVPSRVSWAQLELRLLEAARALLISLSTGVGSAAFTGSIKYRSWPLQHMARPGNLSLPRPGRTSFFLKELMSQTHKITTNAMRVCALKDNYRVTLPPWRLWEGGGGSPDRPRADLSSQGQAL